MTNDVVFSDLIQAFSSLRFFAGVRWGWWWWLDLVKPCEHLINGKIPKLSVLLSSASHLSFLCLHSLAAAAAAKSLQSCPTLCDPKDGSPPGSPVPGILQARILEWVAISFSNA